MENRITRSLFEVAKTVMGDVTPESGKKLIKHH